MKTVTIVALVTLMGYLEAHADSFPPSCNSKQVEVTFIDTANSDDKVGNHTQGLKATGLAETHEFSWDESRKIRICRAFAFFDDGGHLIRRQIQFTMSSQALDPDHYSLEYQFLNTTQNNASAESYNQARSEEDATELCARSEVVKVFTKILNPSGFSDEAIKGAGGSPFTLVVDSGMATNSPHIYKCIVAVKSQFLVLTGHPQGMSLVFKLETLSDGRFYVTHMTGTGW